MSKGIACSCTGPQSERMKNWRIVQYKCNHSAFNGGRETRSDYSCFRCIVCRHLWRSKSDYVYKVLQLSKGLDPWENR